jgi:signal transduction histidine kinase
MRDNEIIESKRSKNDKDEDSKLILMLVHDLKTQLYVMKLVLDKIFLENFDDIPSSIKIDLNKMKSIMDNLQKMIFEIIEYMKIDKIYDNFETVEIEMIVKDIVRSSFEHKPLTIHFETSLPRLKFNKVLIRQLFVNLISNALKYAKNNNPIINITSKLIETKKYEIRIKDNGIGISKENIQNVFDLFWTLKGKSDLESTGIGLAIVKKVVSLWGGEIWVESSLEHGTTFIFTIPIEYCC